MRLQNNSQEFNQRILATGQLSPGDLVQYQSEIFEVWLTISKEDLILLRLDQSKSPIFVKCPRTEVRNVIAK